MPARFELDKPIQALKGRHNLLLFNENLRHERMVPFASNLSDHFERDFLAGNVVPREIDLSTRTLAEKLEQLEIPDIHDAGLGKRDSGYIGGWRRKSRGGAYKRRSARRGRNDRRIFENWSARKQGSMRNGDEVLDRVQRLENWWCHKDWASRGVHYVVNGLSEGDGGDL